MNRLVGEISHSAEEQATGLNEVNSAVGQMDQVTQQNAAMVEQATAASHAMAGEAAELARLVGLFQIGEAQAHVAEKPAPRHASPAPASRARQPTHVAAAPRAHASAEDWDEF